MELFVPREVTDNNGITWNLVEAYAGLKENKEEKNDAAQVDGKPDLVYVVCTPSGGEQTVRLELPQNWEDSLSDEDLLREIEENKNS
jgi:hypothetical protein